MVDVTFKVPIYNVKIRVIICDNIDTFCKQNNVDDGNVFDEAVVYDFTTYDTEFDFICLFNYNIKEGIIAHEVFHLTAGILRWVGIPLTKSSEEAYAYLNGWLNIQIRKIVLKHDIEKRK